MSPFRHCKGLSALPKTFSPCRVHPASFPGLLLNLKPSCLYSLLQILAEVGIPGLFLLVLTLCCPCSLCFGSFLRQEYCCIGRRKTGHEWNLLSSWCLGLKRQFRNFRIPLSLFLLFFLFPSLEMGGGSSLGAGNSPDRVWNGHSSEKYKHFRK